MLGTGPKGFDKSVKNFATWPCPIPCAFVSWDCGRSGLWMVVDDGAVFGVGF